MNSRIAFLDRDGTLIENTHYLSEPARVKLLPGVIEGLLSLKQLGFWLVMVSNQSGVGRGYFPESAVHLVNQRLQELLLPYQVQLDLLLFCPHHPEDHCTCRKPRPGLVQRACHQLKLGLHGAIVVGDSDCDMLLAQALNIPGYRVGSAQLATLAGLSCLLH